MDLKENDALVGDELMGLTRACEDNCGNFSQIKNHPIGIATFPSRR